MLRGGHALAERAGTAHVSATRVARLYAQGGDDGPSARLARPRLRTPRVAARAPERRLGLAVGLVDRFGARARRGWGATRTMRNAGVTAVGSVPCWHCCWGEVVDSIRGRRRNGVDRPGRVEGRVLGGWLVQRDLAETLDGDLGIGTKRAWSRNDGARFMWTATKRRHSAVAASSLGVEYGDAVDRHVDELAVEHAQRRCPAAASMRSSNIVAIASCSARSRRLHRCGLARRTVAGGYRRRRSVAPAVRGRGCGGHA